MGVGASLLVGALGAFLRIEVAAQAAGFKMHAIGVILMIASVIGVIASVRHWSTWGGFNHGRAFRYGDTVVIDGVNAPSGLR